MTEVYHCPLAGDGPNPSHRYHRPSNPNPLFMVVGRLLPGDLTDAQAEHERAMTAADRIPGLVAAGLTDPQIAAELGRSLSHVRRLRRDAGLPPNRPPYGDVRRAKSRQVLLATVARLGVRSLRQAGRRDAHLVARSRLAARYNLPADLHRVQVRLLLALTTGPLTADALAALIRPHRAALGYRAFAYNRAPSGNHLGDLCRRGLVARLVADRGAGNGSGKGASIYLLTMTALDLLSRTESP